MLPGWGDGLRTKHVAVELTDEKGVHSVVLLPVTAAVRESMNLSIIPGHVELDDSTPNKTLSFSLFARGDKAIIDRLPPTINCGTSLTPRVEINRPAMEGRRASREIAVVLRASAVAGHVDETRILEIVVNGKDPQTIQIPLHVRAVQ